jgi:hypothetical protein
LFESIDEINANIDTARKHGSPGFLSVGEVAKLKAPLASCGEKLQEWVYANMNNPEYLPKKRGIFRR